MPADHNLLVKIGATQVKNLVDFCSNLDKLREP